MYPYGGPNFRAVDIGPSGSVGPSGSIGPTGPSGSATMSLSTFATGSSGATYVTISGSATVPNYTDVLITPSVTVTAGQTVLFVVEGSGYTTSAYGCYLQITDGNNNAITTRDNLLVSAAASTMANCNWVYPYTFPAGGTFTFKLKAAKINAGNNWLFYDAKMTVVKFV